MVSHERERKQEKETNIGLGLGQRGAPLLMVPHGYEHGRQHRGHDAGAEQAVEVPRPQPGVDPGQDGRELLVDDARPAAPGLFGGGAAAGRRWCGIRVHSRQDPVLSMSRRAWLRERKQASDLVPGPLLLLGLARKFGRQAHKSEPTARGITAG